jgi:hypothetical protein
MIRKTYQSFTQDDLLAVTHGRGSIWLNLLVITLPIAAVIVAVVHWLTSSWWIALLPAVFFSGFSLLSNLLFAARVSRLKALLGRENSVEVIEVDAITVETLKSPRSAGPAYCFFCADGQAILLTGSWLKEVRGFPTLQFQVARIADTGEPITLEPAATAVIPAPSLAALRKSHKIAPVTQLRAKSQNLQQALDRELEQTESKAKK